MSIPTDPVKLQRDLRDLQERRTKIKAALKIARDKTQRAWSAMDAAWQKLVCARDAMNAKLQPFKDENRENHQIWTNFNALKREKKAEIKVLRERASAEHTAMLDNLKRAENAHIWRAIGEPAEVYRQRAEENRIRRDELHAKVHELLAEIETAKKNAECSISNDATLEFNFLKSDFELARLDHGAAREDFLAEKDKRDRFNEELCDIEAEIKRLELFCNYLTPPPDDFSDPEAEAYFKLHSESPKTEKSNLGFFSRLKHWLEKHF